MQWLEISAGKKFPDAVKWGVMGMGKVSLTFNNAGKFFYTEFIEKLWKEIDLFLSKYHFSTFIFKSQ